MARARTRAEYVSNQEAPSGFDAYSGMLLLSLLATITGIVFLFLDYKDYPDKLPNLKGLSAPASSGAARAPG